MNFRRCIAALASLPAVVAVAAEDGRKLAACAAIGAAPDRLACYDALAGRAPANAAPVASRPLAETAPTDDEPSTLAATGTLPADPRQPPSTLLSRYWELDPGDKRGVFNIVGYRPNYVMPLHVTNRINHAPQSPTQAATATSGYRREEVKFQLSLRAKLAQDIGLPGADLWAAFTMQTMWQLFDAQDSRPFRNTDYQPELTYIVPTPANLRGLPFGWQWRFTQLGIAHQSNGQSDPLSRSWNRVYAGVGIEHKRWWATLRLDRRLDEAMSHDNNPDLADYRGRSEFQLGWAGGAHTASLLYRGTPGNGRGGMQFDWTYPVFRDQPNGLRWYVQLFDGYGETLTDYNFRQTSAGIGVTFLQF